jgi:hypothetical protein
VPLSAKAERRFFTGYMFGLTVLVFAGFAPTFFLRGLVDPYWPPLHPIRPVVLAHGIVTTAWVLLFPLQALLIAKGHRALHMRIGRWGFAVGCLIAVMIYLVAADQYRRAIGPSQPLTDFLSLVIALALAWRWRWDARAHKRMMVAILCLLTVAAVGRIPVQWDRMSLVGPWTPTLIPFALILPLWLWDLRTMAKVHMATLAGTTVLSFNLLRVAFAPPNPEWSGLFALLPGFAWP